MASTPHRYHPDPKVGDPVDAIVWDDCEACVQNSRDPFAHMDSDHLRRIQDRLIGVVNANDRFLTRCEVLACRKFYEDIERTFGPEVVIPWPSETVRETFEVLNAPKGWS